MSITDLKRKAAASLEPAERRKLVALEAAALENLTAEQIERIKRDPGLGTCPTMRLVMAAFNRQDTELGRDAAERKSEVERAARMRI